MENWKDIAGYEGRYLVSDTGIIKSLLYSVRKKGTGTILRPGLDSWGYPRVALCKNGKLSTKKVHRLVAQAFIPNPENKAEVNHKNGIKTDNCVANLEWSTRTENHRHALRTALYVPPRGAAHHHSRVTMQYTLDMVLVAEHETLTAAAKAVNGSHANIWSCIQGRFVKMYGFKWKYK